MPIEFDITLTPKDMYRFNLYQTYTGFQGWFSIIVSIFIFVSAGLTYGEVTLTRTVLYIVLGIVFLFYMPVTLYLRSKHNVIASDVLKNALHYSVTDKGFAVSQNEASAELPWEQIYKMISTKNNVLVYSSRINAYVIPRQQLGETYQELAKLAKEKLPKYRVNMK